MAVLSSSLVLDTNPIGLVRGNSGTVIGTQFFQGTNPAVLYQRDNSDHHPLVLTSSDSAIVQNAAAGPATGTFTVLVTFAWLEVAVY